MIYVGTSGYSYKDWVGLFYPEGTKQRDMLEYYARQFPAVEINATYYSVFSDKTFAGMAERTPNKFRFSIKAPGTATHLPAGTRMRLHADVKYFGENIEPLVRIHTGPRNGRKSICENCGTRSLTITAVRRQQKTPKCSRRCCARASARTRKRS